MYDEVNEKTRVGNVVFNGVEMRNGGQESFQSRATLNFINVIDSVASSSVTGSSFANCYSWCVSVHNSQNISMTNNVLFKGVGGLTTSLSLKSFTFSNNLIVGVGRSVSVLSKMTACVTYRSYNNPSDLNEIMNNICQGSQGYGFVLPHVKCT